VCSIFFAPTPHTQQATKLGGGGRKKCRRSKQRSWGVGGKKTKQTKKLVFFKLREIFFYFTKQAMLFFSILVTLKIRPSRQVCRPSAEIADKLVGYLNENFD
jgi:hypothetical protein